MVSVFPTLLALTAMLGFLDDLAGADLADRAQREVLAALRELLTDEADTLVDAVDDLFDRPSPGVLTVGVALALWAASRGFAGVIRALDVAYGLPEQRGWLHQRLVGLGLSLGTVVVVAFMLAMLLVGPLLGAGGSVADTVGLGPGFATAWDWLRWPAVLVVALGWATTVFHAAPNQRTPWRWDAPGALVTAVSWIVVSVGFRLYLDTVGSANEVFGVLGGAIIALVWLYLLAVGLLLGGEVNGLLTSMRRHAGTQARPAPDDGATTGVGTTPDAEGARADPARADADTDAEGAGLRPGGRPT